MKCNNNEAIVIAKQYQLFIETSYKTKSPHTVLAYEEAFKIFLLFLQDVKKVTFCNLNASSFSKDNIDEFLSWLTKERRCSAQTCNIRLSGIRAFLRHLANNKPEYIYLYLEAMQMDGVRGCQPDKVLPLTEESLTQILEQASSDTSIGLRYLTLMTFLFTTATRISEVLSIKVGELCLEAPKPYVTVCGKGQKYRTVYLPPKLMKHLNEYLKDAHGVSPQPNAYLFYSRTKGMYCKSTTRGVNKQLHEYAKSAHESNAKVPSHLHSHQFRHTAATMLLDNGMEIFQISKLLGHASITTTMNYLGITDKMRENAVKTFEGSVVNQIQPKWTVADVDSLLKAFGFSRKKK